MARRVSDGASAVPAAEGTKERPMSEFENPAAPAASAAGEELERELAELLEVERFEPSPAFRAQALLNDPAIYERAEREPLRWWAEQAETLHWFSRWEQVLDDSNPPFYRWFVGGTLNASYNCLDR